MASQERFDVVVAGGGAGGVGAAIGAARAGARVALLERYGFLGGAATNANVLSYCGFYAQGPEPLPAVGGVGAEVLARLRALGCDTTPIRSPSGNWIVLFDPEALKLVLDGMLAEAGVALRLHALASGAEATPERLHAVLATDHAGTVRMAARAFVDASGEGDLAALAGLPSHVDAARGDAVQAASFPFRVAGVPPGAEPDRAALTGLAAGINAARDAAGDPGPRLRPGGGTFIRLPMGQEIWWMGIDLATDGLGAAGLTRAEQEGRRLAWECVRALRRLPGAEGAYLIGTGPQLGIRETRRPMARRTLTGQAGLEGRRDPCAVARAAWPMEVHGEAGRPTFQPIGGAGFFDVPLDALRAAGVDNLWLAGRLIGADAQAYGSVRVMGTGFATGQAAGVAAALQAAGGAPAEAVRAALREQGAIL
ncbi:FAD-dependent oxidoreductase [Roseomonas sp. OT10]|uniref:FAD-dependent oxidoreductase n=1 Tax=Roseomonas cutis TaxID=2897332 RepID=UPI001E2E2397|nr:FAD-dependent oxidoreductase [Roseomonas sp. OT10]UFN47247.1 FAD-dependent oxidoreductase [Roseomonas sp. OT10]